MVETEQRIEDGSEVYPGQLLVENLQELAPGTNTYTYLGKVYAQVSGHIVITRKSKWNEQAMDMISVEAFNTEAKLQSE